MDSKQKLDIDSMILKYYDVDARNMLELYESTRFDDMNNDGTITLELVKKINSNI